MVAEGGQPLFRLISRFGFGLCLLSSCFANCFDDKLFSEWDSMATRTTEIAVGFIILLLNHKVFNVGMQSLN